VGKVKIRSVKPDNQSSDARRAWWRVAALLAIAALVVFVRLRLLQIPLERDEGEYAYSGQLMLDGVPPYQMAWNMKLPGTYAAYALMMRVFGESIGGIHFGFLLANLGALTLLYFIARRLTGSWGAVAACATYALLSLSPGVLGLAGHATHLVTLAALGGFLLLLRARETGSGAGLFWSGLCFGLAFLCKQPGLYFGVFGLCLVFRDGTRTRPVAWGPLLRKAGLFSAGMVLPFALICLILWRLGTFERFWFWTFTYAQFYAGKLDFETAWDQLLWFLKVCGWVKWSLPWAAAGLVCLFLGKGNADRRFILTTLLVFSMAAFAAGFYFRSHYFIVMLPVVSLLTAVAVCEAAQALAGVPTAAGRALTAAIAVLTWAAIYYLRRGPFQLQMTPGAFHLWVSLAVMAAVLALAFPRLAPAALFALACAGFVCNQGRIWFQITPEAVCRAEYRGNPFVESVEIGRYIREHSAADARVAVFGSEPQIYFYAHRRSASGFIYMYDLVQLNDYAGKFQRDMITEIEAARPRFLVVVKVSSSWLNRTGADETLDLWSTDYMRRFYDGIGMAYVYPDHSDYVWGPESAKGRSDTKFVIAVYQRKEQI
jgi:hypothetical protein